jgi:hypothetical protein
VASIVDNAKAVRTVGHPLDEIADDGVNKHFCFSGSRCGSAVKWEK